MGSDTGTAKPRTANIKEVARRAGVSVSTVSNVLNRPETVAPATRQRVQDAIAALGYVRNDSARQLRAGRSRTIAIVVMDLGNPFFTDVVRGAELAAEEQGSVVIVCNSGDDAGRERRHLELLEEQRVQGILITPMHGPLQAGRPSALDALIRRGTPVVLVDRESGRSDHCSVAVHDVLGGRLAGEHLVAQGHRRIAYVGGPADLQQVADRHRGLLEATAGTAEVAVFTTPGLTSQAGRAAGEQIADLPAPRRPTAVFCANDLLALGVLQVMTLRGLDVPRDVAIVGYDDIEFAGSAAVPLSSVRQPRTQLGRAAARLLLEEIQDGPEHRHRNVVFQPELVVRRSSAGTGHEPEERFEGARR